MPGSRKQWLLAAATVLLAFMRARRTVERPTARPRAGQNSIQHVKLGGKQAKPQRTWQWTRRHRFLFTIEALVVLGAIAALVYFYFYVTQLSDYPQQPEEPGEVKLYFDVPGVPAILDVNVEDRGSVDVGIYTDKSYEPNSVGFRLVFTGLLARAPEWPYEREQDKYGCWRSVHVIPAGSAGCALVKGSANGLPANPKTVDQLVVSGTIDRNSFGDMLTQVRLYPDHKYSKSAGKRAYFTLPKIGTPYIPPRARSARLDIGTDAPVFAPSKLDVVVDYRDLRSNERVDSVAPDLTEAGKLSWVEVDAALVGPRGSIVDIALEDTGQRWLYLIGVIIGLLAAIVPLVAVSGWKRLAKVRGKPEPGH